MPRPYWGLSVAIRSVLCAIVTNQPNGITLALRLDYYMPWSRLYAQSRAGVRGKRPLQFIANKAKVNWKTTTTLDLTSEIRLLGFYSQLPRKIK